MAFDANLVGTWKLKGASPPFATYRIDTDGRYFSAYPASPYSFASGGLALNWGGVTYTKKLGSPGELVGVWDADSGGEEWSFRADGSVTVHYSATDEWFGRYESRDGDSKLWYEEFRSVLSTQGQEITFDPPYAQNLTYGYAIASSGDLWTLTDAVSGAVAAEYERV